MSEITDYGEKIGGARKDLFAAWFDRLAPVIGQDPEMLRSASLSANFPKPDYEALAGSGVSPTSLAAICAARGAVGKKPMAGSAKGLDAWLVRLNAAIMVAEALTRGRGAEGDRNVVLVMEHYGPDVMTKFNALRRMPPAALNLVESLILATRNGEIFLGDRNRKVIDRRPDGRNGEERVAIAHAMLAAAATGQAPKPKRATDPVDRHMRRLSVFRFEKDRFVIAIGDAKKMLVIRDGFPRKQDAIAWARGNMGHIRGVVARSLNVVERTGEIGERRGPARRAGQETTEGLASRFGLRAIEFGNYVEASRRRKDLNDTADSFADLSAVLGIPERAIGQGGALAAAFGARGGGRARGHYEENRRVFNLTKTSGAGVLAHEWFHAADNAATMADATDPEARANGFASRTDRDLLVAFRDSGYAGRMLGLDALRSSEYWSMPEEMAARSFETWLDRRLRDEGISNGHLIDICRESDAYPTEDEMRVIGPKIEALTKRIANKIVADMGVTPVGIVAAPQPAPAFHESPALEGDEQPESRGLGDDFDL